MMLTPISELLNEGLRPDQVPHGGEDKRLRQVAAEFESLLLAQMLKSFREASAGGLLGEAKDQAGATMVELAEQQFARTLASQGGLGLGDLIVRGLSRPVSSDAGELQSPPVSDDKS